MWKEARTIVCQENIMGGWKKKMGKKRKEEKLM
jgi:hypothetical protein